MRRFLMAGLLVLLGACSTQLAPAIEVDLGEFWIAPQSETLRAGTVTISIENYGEYAHTLVVSDVFGDVIAATDPIEPGAVAELAVDLAPGKYIFTCRIVNGLSDGRLIDHYQEGMSASVRVAAESA